MRRLLLSLLAVMALSAVAVTSALADWTAPTVDYTTTGQTVVTTFGTTFNAVLPLAGVLIAIMIGWKLFKRLIKSH